MPLGYRGSGRRPRRVVPRPRADPRRERHRDGRAGVRAHAAPRPRRASSPRTRASGPAALSLLLARQRETEDRIESLLFRNVEGRLAEFLLKAADRWGVPTPKGTLISAPITHLEIAQSIGSTRETVTLTLGALRREGLLDVAGRRLIVRDREALSAR